MDNPHISKIRIYPVKSLDPVEVIEAEIGIRSLKHDRTFALLGKDGRFVNGKRTGRVNQLKSDFDLDQNLIHLTSRSGGITSTFELKENNKGLTKYLEDFFEIKLTVLYRTKGELMDIPGASSVTFVSKASLKSLHNDFSNKTLEDLRLRFRSNIEIDGVPPYWEENLFSSPGIGMRFLVGNVEMIGVSPRARCNVPPRNPLTGETDKSFVKKMIESRNHNLPEKSKLPLYGNMYHLTVNTYIPEDQKGKIIKLGDPIKILESIQLN